ncbi:MAG: zinc-ribbon domain and TM2 domain-containing protein [Thermotogae bacterium]|jgi:TM2 domain-containing membrane protein YozV|nr:zinc-ribbon domain and TM2 domain-containing protein [Thermotogota bacterium]MCL5032372.1 zinc-ribbon domain and TM2 domain-containing protein [Thermotogota bacterium]
MAETGKKYCVNCGAEIDEKAEICPKCGVRQPASTIPSSYAPYQSGDEYIHHKRITAGILGILLGGLGIHQFYLHNIGWGILMLIFCWTGIPAIIGLIQGILYLTETDEYFGRVHRLI